MTIRIREGAVASVLIDDWYQVKLGSFQIDNLDFISAPKKGTLGTIDDALEEGFIFTLAEHEHNMIAGPLKSIKAVRLVKE